LDGLGLHGVGFDGVDSVSGCHLSPRAFSGILREL